jgi:hypothetical protein
MILSDSEIKRRIESGEIEMTTFGDFDVMKQI